MNLPSISILPFPAFYDVVNRYSGTTHYSHGNGQYCYGSDTMFTVPLKSRTASSLIGGRVIADKLSKETPLTLDMLTGELGGAQPIPDDHPLKATAVRAASLILAAGWQFAWNVADGHFTLEMDRQLSENDELPAFIPKTFTYAGPEDTWTATFAGMDLIFTLAGGQFTVPAGMAFHYLGKSPTPSPIDGGPQSCSFSVEVYFQSVPEEHRAEQITGLRQLIMDRNQIFELIAEQSLTAEIARIIGILTEEKLLEESIIEAAQKYDEAHRVKETPSGE